MDLREIDRLIAEKVMGWVYPPGVDPWVDNDAWCPSTDITAAWQVVDQWKGDNQPLSAPTINLRRTADGQWECLMLDIGAGRDLSKSSVAVAQTAPLAICLAALKAAGVKVSA